MSSCQCGCCGSQNPAGCSQPPTATGSTTCDEWLCSAAGTTTDDCASFTYNPPATIDQLSTNWSGRSCPGVFRTILYSGGDNTTDCQQLARLQGDTYNLMKVYTEELDFDFTSNTTIAGNVPNPQYNPFQQEIISMCASNQTPGICDLFLTEYCAKYTEAEISSDFAKAQLCGCYIGGYGITIPSPSCAPLCHMIGTVQLPDLVEAGKSQECSGSVCVIDQTSINLINTQTKNPVAYTQICPDCSETNPCTCIISGSNVTQTLQESGMGPVYQQICGPTNAQCYTVATDGASPVNVPCPPVTAFLSTEPSITFPIVFVVVVVIIIILAGIIMLVSRHSKKEIDTPETSYYTIGVGQGPKGTVTGVPGSGTQGTAAIGGKSVTNGGVGGTQGIPNYSYTNYPQM